MTANAPPKGRTRVATRLYFGRIEELCRIFGRQSFGKSNRLFAVIPPSRLVRNGTRPPCRPSARWRISSASWSPRRCCHSWTRTTREMPSARWSSNWQPPASSPPGQQESITKAVLDREQMASTGIGKGIAIPHARHPAVERVVAALAFSQVGIDFDSVDGENVHWICLVLSPADRPADHLLALQAVSRHMANTDYAAWRSPHRHRHVADPLPRQACASLAGFLRRGDI